MRNPISDAGKFGRMAEREARLTAEQIRSALLYEPETGDFYWKVRAGRFLPGAKAGYICGPDGYVKIGINRQHYSAHRLAWLYVHGAWPTHSVDHINQVKSDNRISNLRDVPMNVNVRNQSIPHSHSKTGILGVSFKGKRFLARITVNGIKRVLGSFDTAEEAHAAYLDAKRVLHGTDVRSDHASHFVARV